TVKNTHSTHTRQAYRALPGPDPVFPSSSPLEKDLKVNQEALFAVQCNGARGVVDAKVHTPSGSAEECYITDLDSDKNTIRFIPRENGVHSIDVKFNGSHIPGSPFNVRVGEAGQAGDPGMVTVYGPGLDGGSTGTYTTLYLLLIFLLPLYTDPMLLTTHVGEVCHQ
ncbi:unnamed protein product, partial [Oncorhynchus mykiss]